MRKMLLLSFLPAGVMLGCSPEARDRMTRFLFEVPETPAGDEAQVDTGQPAEAALPAPSTGSSESQFASVHPPYSEHECGACHDPGRQMRVAKDLAAACRKCHARHFSGEVKHEPVAGGECHSCHVSHRSRYLHLLNASPLETCTTCHDGPADLSQDAHSVPGAENCGACHDPHFGSAPYLKAKGSPTPAGGA